MTNVLNSEFTNYVNYLKTEGTGSSHAFDHTTISVNIAGLADHAGQTLAVKNALAFWTLTTGLKFTYTTGTADISFDNTYAGAYASTSWSGSRLLHSSVNVEKNWVSNWGIGAYGVQTFIHEIGHALGLNHGGPYNGSGTYGTDAIFSVDTWQYSVMSYFTQNNHDDATAVYLIAPMIGDIKAINDLYGRLAVNVGDTVYGNGETVMGGWTDFGRYSVSSYCINDTGGVDTMDYSNTGVSAVIDLRAGYFSSINGLHGNVSIALGSIIENAFGGAGDDMMFGNEVGNIIRGNAGADLLYGYGGNDILSGGRGADYLDGGLGADVASYSDATAGVTVNLLSPFANTGDALGDVYVSIENLQGSNYNDDLTGDAGANVIWSLSGNDVLDGGDGNDTLYGGLGSDTLYGGNGNDVLYGGAGADYLDGGDGIDTISYGDATSGLTVYLSAPAYNTGFAYGDRYTGIENLVGSSYNDLLVGDSLANTIQGGAGNDSIYGGGGNDVLYGQAGVDLLSGGAGNDLLFGGVGADRLYGGLGADRFVFVALSDSTYATTGRDTIYDFKYAEGDRIDVSSIDANIFLAGDQAFSFIGTRAFTGVAGQMHVQTVSTTDCLVTCDVNGDRVADFSLYLSKGLALSSACFLL